MNASFLLSTANPFYRLRSSPCNASCSHLNSRKESRRRGGCHTSRAFLGPEALFSAATVTVIPLYTLMIGLPRANLTRRILQPGALYAAAAALYCLLLVLWWPKGVGRLCQEVYQSCTPLPDVHVLARVFKSAHATALAWVHLLLLDLVQAREVWLDGLRQDVATGHSIVLCFMFGPLGMLSHMVTRRACRHLTTAPPTGVSEPEPEQRLQP